MKLFKGIVLFVALSFAACGGKTMKEFTPTAQDKENVSTVANKTSELKTLNTSADANQGLNRVQQISNASQQLIGSQQSRNSGALTAALTSLKAVTGAATEGCPTQTGTKYTWTNCTDGDTTMNGFMDATETKFEIDLTSSSQNGTNYAGDYVWKGSVTFNGNVIEGSMSFEMTMNIGVDYSYDITTTYTGLTLDAAGCPIAGTLAVDADVDVAGIAGLPGSSSNVSVEFTFGPACGDMAAIGG